MKNLAYAVMICFGVASCAVSDQDDSTITADDEIGAPAETAAAQESPGKASEVTVRGDELTSYNGGGKQTNACNRAPDGPCFSGYFTCNFQCCSGAIRSVQAVCGECNARAASWCGSGVQATWWSL